VKPSQRAFVLAVAVVGLGVLGWALVQEAADLLDETGATFWILAAAILVAELFPVQIPGHEGQVTFSTPFAFALLIDRGTAVTVIVATLMVLIADTLRRRRADRTVFNAAQYAICYALAGGILELLSGGPDANGVQASELPALAASAAVFLVVNTTLASAPPALGQGVSLWTEVRSDLGFQAWAAAVLVSFAPIVLEVVRDDPWLTPLLALPMVAIGLGAHQATINQYRARHDRLTGLPNRVQLQERLASGLAEAHRGGSPVAVLLLGLDGFNEVNDTLGLDQGDALLCEVARRLSDAAHPEDLVARFGGDEFALLTARGRDVAEAERLAHQLREALQPPARIQGVDLDVRATVGIALHPRDGDTAELLLIRAGMAQHSAKEDGRAAAVYDHTRDHHSPERLALAAELRHGIEAGELELHYQPKLDLRTGAIEGVEALVRWRHPVRGLLMPDHFMALAERTGLVRPLTRWTLGEATEQQRRWSARGVELVIAVNISARALTPDLPDTVANLAGAHPGTRLEVELTETLMMGSTPESLAIIEALAALGVRLAVDDFGTGYASMAYLQRLPVHEIKIDRGFVTTMDSDRGDRAIVGTIIDLAGRLGLEVVAEGVETLGVLEELRALGCQFAQGYAVGRPTTADAVAAQAVTARANASKASR
jgi:diguanylate cyclase (GGDEF)-like protein